MAFDLGKLIGTIAPTLATMLGGPLAGTAVTAIAQAFGLGADATKEDVVTAVQTTGMTPEIIAAIRKADQDHELALKEADIDVLKLNAAHDQAMYATEVDDRKSARTRETLLPTDYTTRHLAYLVVGCGIAMIATTLAGFAKVDGALAGTLIGYVVSEMSGVLTYYFGGTPSQRTETPKLTSKTEEPK